MSMTLTEAQELSGTEFYDYLDAEAAIPTVTTSACQGDVSILRVTTQPATTVMPKSGVVVAQSGQGGHAHTLTGPGMFDRQDRDLVVGTLTVPQDGEVLMTHPEHGAFLIAPGTYRIGTQREFAGFWRQVAD
jgi:hypothetical protein